MKRAEKFSAGSKLTWAASVLCMVVFLWLGAVGCHKTQSVAQKSDLTGVALPTAVKPSQEPVCEPSAAMRAQAEAAENAPAEQASASPRIGRSEGVAAKPAAAHSWQLKNDAPKGPSQVSVMNPRGGAEPTISVAGPPRTSGKPKAEGEMAELSRTESAPSVGIDHPPVEGDTVKVSDLPPGGLMTPPMETNEFAGEYEAQRAKLSEGVHVEQWQDASDPRQTPPSTLVPAGPVINTGTIESAPPAGGTPSFQDYKAPSAGGGPPDTDMAAGLSYIITDYNSFFRIFDKTGAKQGSDVSFYSFFGTGATPNCGNVGNNVCDPQMVYDDQNDRYVFTCLAVTASTSYICVAATQTGDPRGTWNKYEIQPYAGLLADYPHTAIGEDAIFVGTNNFSMAGAYQNSAIVAINKANLYGGAALTTRSYNLAATYYNPRPVVRRGYNQAQYPPAGKPHYFMVNDGTNAATIWQWVQPTFSSNPAAIGGWSDAYPGTGANPSDAAYTNAPMDALSTKIMDGEIRWPKLWFVRTGLNGSYDIIRWAEVDMTNATPTTVESGNLGATTNHLWMPDCTIDKNNSMAMVFTKAGISPTVLVGSYMTGHDSGGTTPTPAGTMEAIQTSKTGEVVYTGALQSGVYRWGDYMGCQIDPNGCDIWINGMYSATLPTTQKESTWVQKWSFADCTPGATRLASMSAPVYQCHKTASATITDTAGTPTNAVYHSTSGAVLGATISGGPNNFTVSAVTLDQLGAADGNDVWLTFTGDDAATYSSAHSKLDCSLNVTVLGVDNLAGGCDNDVYMDQGETLNVNVAMVNNETFDLPTGFFADLVVDPAHPNANITIVNGTSAWGPIAAGQSAYASGMPFQVRYTGAGGGPILCYFKIQNIRATDTTWASASAYSFTEYANTNDSLATTYISESFDGTTFPPTNWTNTQVSGTGLWQRLTAMTHPTMSPHSGAGMAEYDCYNYKAGISARLATPVVNLGTATLPKVSFWMTHDTTYSSYKDNLAIQVSTDGGTTWQAPVATVYRSQNGTSAGVWLNSAVDLSAYAGQTNVKIGFLATSEYGDNFALDDVLVGNYNRVNDPNNCTTAAPVLTHGVYDWEFDDSQCNNDPGDTSKWQWYGPGWSDDAGESGTMTFYIGNSGNEDAYNVNATLTCPSCPAGVTICKNTASYGTLPYGTSYVYGPGSNGFEIALAPTVTPGQYLPFVLTFTTSNSPAYNPVININPTPPIDPFHEKTGTPTLMVTAPSVDNTMEDHFTTAPNTAGSGGRLGFSTAWTGTATKSTAFSSDADGACMSIGRSASAIHMWPTNTIGVDCDIMFYLDLRVSAAGNTFFMDYTNDGGTTWVTLNGTGYTGLTAGYWYSLSNSLYFWIKSVSGQAAAQAIYNNPNFGLRFRVTGTGTIYDYIDNFQLAYYKYTNKATSCAYGPTCAPPDPPAINLIVDNSPCALTGIKVYYTGSQGSVSYDLLKDAVSVVTGYVSGSTYSPGDSNSHTYTIRANNANGSTQSPGYAFADAVQTWTPTVTCTPGTCSSSSSVLLTSESGYTGYQWYNNGTPIGGATSSTYTASTSGNYTVSYAAGACSSTNLSAAKAVTITAASAPPKVPYTTTPLKAVKSTGVVTWDATNCPSTNYHLIYGKGENLAAWTVDNGACSMGTSGSYTWSGLSAIDPSTYTSRFLWFLVVGDNGGTTEGSWGLTSANAQEGGANPSNVCGFTTKDTSGTCGTP